MKDKTHIIYIIDRSGSMSGKESDVIGGFNRFIKEQKKLPGKASLTLVQFDHEYGPTSNYNNIHSVGELSKETYQPRGTTALLDAVGRTIDRQGKILSDMKEKDRPNKVIVLIMTDGLENASTDYTKSRIKDMITHQQDKYDWKFVFLGANQDAFAEAGSMGISLSMTTNYTNTSLGIKRMYDGMNDLVSSYRSTGNASFDDIGRPS